MINKSILTPQICLLTAGAFLLPAFASADELVLRQGLSGYTGTLDTFTNEGAPTSAYGSESNLAVRSGINNTRTSLISFDLATLETLAETPGFNLESASLSFYVETMLNTRTAAASIYRMDRAWTAGTSAFGSGATWRRWDAGSSSDPSDDAGEWVSRLNGANGGLGSDDRQTTATDSFSIAGVTFEPGARTYNDWVEFDVLSDVGAFLGGTTNYGWLLADTSPNDQQTVFTSSDSASDITQRPTLTFAYTIVPEASSMGLIFGSVAGLFVFINLRRRQEKV